jgi:hypothetical protein
VSIFNDSHSKAHPPEKLVFQILHRHIQVACNEPDFGSAHPDISLGRACAAPPALQALKVQTRGVPFGFVIAAIHSSYFTAEHAESAEKTNENLKSQIQNYKQIPNFN